LRKEDSLTPKRRLTNGSQKRGDTLPSRRLTLTKQNIEEIKSSYETEDPEDDERFGIIFNKFDEIAIEMQKLNADVKECKEIKIPSLKKELEDKLEEGLILATAK